MSHGFFSFVEVSVSSEIMCVPEGDRTILFFEIDTFK